MGLCGLALVGLALLTMAGELLWVGWHRVRPLGGGPGFPSYPLERLIVDTDAVRQMDMVEPTLSKLVQPASVTSEDVIGAVSDLDYSMFGERTSFGERPSLGQVTLGRPTGARPYPYRVSMTYISGDHSYAVIDEKLYRQNAPLPHGENLAEVSDGEVRLDSATGRRWIAIQNGGN